MSQYGKVPTNDPKQKKVRGRRKVNSFQDMEDYKTNKWDAMVDKWIGDNENSGHKGR